jgi:hypothetical protein
LPCQPPDWLQAASDEITHGNVYVVSKKAAPQGYRR